MAEDEILEAVVPVDDAPETVAEAAELLERARFEVKRWIVGQDAMLERVMAALLARGHVLLEGVPGLAKTLTIRTVAAVFGGTFRRIQFTPDLLPADLVGTRVLDPKTGKFRVELGPVFANFLLADEINRAPAKVQSALLEVMQEQTVTIGGETFKVPLPFLTLATQNPIESEGTYPLPEAQTDRFMMKVVIDYPDYGEELEVVNLVARPPVPPRRVLGPAALEGIQRLVDEVFVDHRIREYAVALVTATRKPGEFGVGEVGPYIEYGASPRGSINLVLAARALAVMRGRDYVVPSDVVAVIPDVLRHRIIPSYRALAEDVAADDIVKRVAEVLRPPDLELARRVEGA
jgi:MoxR-like ATPase